MTYIEGERGQHTLFSTTLDELIPEDHVCVVRDGCPAKTQSRAFGSTPITAMQRAFWQVPCRLCCDRREGLVVRRLTYTSSVNKDNITHQRTPTSRNSGKIR